MKTILKSDRFVSLGVNALCLLIFLGAFVGSSALIYFALNDGGRNDITVAGVLAEAQKLGPAEVITTKTEHRSAVLDSILLNVNGKQEHCSIMFEEPYAYANCGEQLGNLTVNYRSESK